MITKTTPRNVFEVLGIFCFCLVMFTWGLYGQEVIGFESRFYLFALEMWRNGPSWFPTTYNQPYPDYPATSTILIYITSLFAGGLSKFTAVLPSAIAASLAVVITYLTGALQNKRWGLYGIFFLLMTLDFFKSARTISLDMYVTVITASCFYVAYSADLKDKPLRLWCIYPLLILAFLFRGPIGVVVPTGVLTIYYFFAGEFKKLFITGISASIILSIGTMMLLSVADYVGGDPFMHDVMNMEIAGRINNNFLPYYFYFKASLSQYALAYPLALLVMLGVCYFSLAESTISSSLKFVAKLFAYVMVVMIGLSIPGDKKIRYILPMTPALALMAAYPFVAPMRERYFIFLRSLLRTLILFIPFLCIIALNIIYSKVSQTGFGLNQAGVYVFCFLVAAQICIGLIYYFKLQDTPLYELYLLLIAFMSFALAYIFVIEPIDLYLNRARKLVKTVELQRSAYDARLVFYKERQDGLPIKYIINMPQYETPIFMDKPEDLLSFKAPAFFVASKEYFTALPAAVAARYRVVASDKLGHVSVVIFSNTKL